MLINIFKKLKSNYKMQKENVIRVIAVLPDGKCLEAVQTWKDNGTKEGLYHDDLVINEISNELKKMGYEIPGPLSLDGIIKRYPYTASLIRTYNIAFIFKGYYVRQYYDTIISFIPKEITDEQYMVVSKATENTIESVAYDNGNKFSIIDKPLSEYVTNRMK